MSEPKLMIKSNKVYQSLKYFAQIVLPALGTLYFALSQIWGLPNGESVVGTIVALDAFLGIVLGISSSAYHSSGAKYDGTVNVIETEEKKLFSLDILSDPNTLDEKNELVLKVETSQESIQRP